MRIQPIVTPWLGFKSQAKEAADFYVSVIPDSWQIIPANIMEMWKAGNTAKTGRMLEALTGMVKLDKAALEAAFHGS